MAACGVAVGDGDLLPGQAGQLLVQTGLVAFDGQDPVRAAAGEVGDLLSLTVQRISGHHDAGQVADVVEQDVEAGDLVGLGVHAGTGQDDATVLIGQSSAPSTSSPFRLFSCRSSPSSLCRSDC